MYVSLSLCVYERETESVRLPDETIRARRSILDRITLRYEAYANTFDTHRISEMHPEYRFNTRETRQIHLLHPDAPPQVSGLHGDLTSGNDLPGMKGGLSSEGAPDLTDAQTEELNQLAIRMASMGFSSSQVRSCRRGREGDERE